MLKSLVTKSNWEFIKEVAIETHEKTKTRVNFIVGCAIGLFFGSAATGVSAIDILSILWNQFATYVTQLFL